MTSDTSGGNSGDENFFREDYFASPIFFIDKPEWVDSLNADSDPYIELAKQRSLTGESIQNSTDPGSDHGSVYHSEQLINLPEFRELQDWILKSCYRIQESLGFQLDQFQIFITELWVQEFAEDGGGHHSLHTHWNGHISGFYFLKASENTSKPIFCDPRPGAVMNLLPEKDETEITLASSQINYNVIPGRALFFPSYLPHLFAIDHGSEPFRFIHWNCQFFPKSVVSTSD